jgi:hypothetical protein
MASSALGCNVIVDQSRKTRCSCAAFAPEAGKRAVGHRYCSKCHHHEKRHTKPAEAINPSEVANG